MANPEQLALLKISVESWNKWRASNSLRATIDLSKSDLSKVDLTGADLSRVNLSASNLSESNLTATNLSEANLNGANLSRVNLFKAIIYKTNFCNANLSFVKFGGLKLMKTNFSGAIFRDANLSRTNLFEANLSETELNRANFEKTYLVKADLTKANLKRANFFGANLSRACLSGANLSEADLTRADLSEVDLSEADLSGASLINSNLVEAKITNAKISNSKVYGVNVWDLEGEFKEQSDLVITPHTQSSVTVDNLKVAQFIYLILNNKEIRDVINTLTSKVVLILGRFAIPERKVILDTLRNKLREYGFLPIVFDFDRPTDKDFTETIKILSGISFFVIADVTNPKSSPLELQATIPDYQIPFVPIIEEGEYPFSMMIDLQKKYNWVLNTISYDSLETLIEILKPHIIDPAIKKRDELRLIKAQEPTILSGRDLKEKKREL